MEKQKKKNVSILADPWLAQLYATAFILAAGGCTETVLFCGKENFSVTIPFFSGMVVLILFIFYWAAPQWFVKVTFMPDGIRIKPARKKATVRPYKYYQYVYKAFYWHGSPIGVGMYMNYIVVSHRRLWRLVEKARIFLASANPCGARVTDIYGDF